MPDADEPDPGSDPFEAAAGWLARRSRPDWSRAEERRFRAWLAADPAHEKAYREAQSLYAEMGESLAEAPTDAPPACAAAPFSFARRRVLAAAAAAALALAALGSGLWITLLSGPPEPRAYATGVGELRTVELPDGSRVELDAGSRIVWRRQGGERRVSLERGRAVFEVVSRPSRPFVVSAGATSVRVRGTIFAVDRRPAAAAVSVAAGAVEVWRDARARTTLRRGERAVVAAEGEGAVEPVPFDAKRFAAWRSGRLIFRGRPLASVAAELERYVAAEIEIADPALRGFELSGSFERSRPGALLAALEEVMPVRVRRPDPRLIRIEPDVSFRQKNSSSE